MICIVTVFKSPNFGSFLQARALRDLLIQYDKDVYLLDGNFRPWIYKLQVNRMLQALKRLQFSSFYYQLYKIIHNYYLWRSLPSIKLIKAQSLEDVTYVLGSDEIWNVARQECTNPLFWGIGLKGRIISFSPSINNATFEQIKNNCYSIEGLKNMTAISVRDNYSLEVLSNVTSKPIVQTLDPTLLHDFDYYSKSAYARLEYNYIAVYVFERLSDKDIKNIRKFALERNLKLVGLSENISWCDYSVNIKNENPFLYYKDAEYVITNTFHGTAFAINFNTKFVCMARNNRKVNELLALFGLSNRLITDGVYRHLTQIFDEDIDYLKVQLRKESLRQSSISYITQSLLINRD